MMRVPAGEIERIVVGKLRRLLVSPEIAWREVRLLGLDRVTPGITVFGGDTFVNLTVIEGRDGLIVYDTGETPADGELYLNHAMASPRAVGPFWGGVDARLVIAGTMLASALVDHPMQPRAASPRFGAISFAFMRVRSNSCSKFRGLRAGASVSDRASH